MCNVEDVVPLVRLDSLEQVAFGILEVDFDSAGALNKRCVRNNGPGERRINTYPVPDAGRSMLPCLRAIHGSNKLMNH